MKAIGIMAAAALAAGGIAASSSFAAAPQADEAATKEKKICRTYKATGSLTRRTRICRTEAEWRELSQRSRQGVQDLQNSASGAPGCISVHDVACGTAPGPGGALPVPTGSGLNS